MNETNDLLSMLHNILPYRNVLWEIAGVSESTVVRFAIELGYDGYPKLQRAVEELVKNKLTASQRMEVSYDRMQKEDKHILKAILEGDEDRIHSTLNDIDTSPSSILKICSNVSVVVLEEAFITLSSIRFK